jgi:uncharacterized RDD family membrane protein YckC
METIRVNTTQLIDIDYPVAGIGERVSARLIDFAILIAGGLVFLLVFSFTFTIGNTITTYFFYFYGIFCVFYDLLFEIFMNGQSLGKKIMKIKVICLDGTQPTIGKYVIRWIFRLIDFTVTAQVGGLVSVAVTQNKQRIGDIIAGTTLILTEQKTKIDHIAFKPQIADYEPVFSQVSLLSDRDIELVYEVLRTYYKTGNDALIYSTSAKLTNILELKLPEQMNEMQFLQTVLKDYTHITAQSSLV